LIITAPDGLSDESAHYRGAGFIGSHLCDYFLSKGHSVVAMDNFKTSDGRTSAISGVLSDLPSSTRCHEIFDVAGRLDAILHLPARIPQ